MKEPVITWTRALGLFLLLAALPLISCGGGKAETKSPEVASKPDPECDITAHPWEQISPGPCPQSVWSFRRGEGQHYTATEKGCANATGVATYNNQEIVMSVVYAGGAAINTWPLDRQCMARVGSILWTEGPVAGKKVESTLRPLPAAPKPQPANGPLPKKHP